MKNLGKKTQSGKNSQRFTEIWTKGSTICQHLSLTTHREQKLYFNKPHQIDCALYVLSPEA